jgi:hypothetical protein
MVYRRRSIRAGALVAFLFLSTLAFPANIVVPSMEMITRGYYSSTFASFILQTYGNMALQVQGGYKFGGQIAFGLNNEVNLENFSSFPPPSLSFLSASMTIKDVFSAPLNITYFIGLNDVFGSGDGFAEFGAPPIMTRYRGFLYFPTDSLVARPIYDGIYQVQGTGMKIEYMPSAEHVSLGLYAYEDTHPVESSGGIITPGVYSADTRVLLNWDAVKLEGFLGVTSSSATLYGYYRGGVLFYATNNNVEFLAQIGFPRWDPAATAFGVNLFYLLIEPRMHLGSFNIVPTFFWRPGYYMQSVYPDEAGSFDVNLNMYFGDQAKTSFQGGAEGNFQFHSQTSATYPSQFVLTLSPWIGFTTPGITWTFKINGNLWPFVLSSLVDVFVGVRAEI